MSGILAILIAYYMYQLTKGLITYEGPWQIWNYFIVVLIVVMGVVFYFEVKRAIKENKARKEEQAQLRAQYEKKRAEKVRRMYIDDYEEVPVETTAEEIEEVSEESAAEEADDNAVPDNETDPD